MSRFDLGVSVFVCMIDESGAAFWNNHILTESSDI